MPVHLVPWVEPIRTPAYSMHPFAYYGNYMEYDIPVMVIPDCECDASDRQCILRKRMVRCNTAL